MLKKKQHYEIFECYIGNIVWVLSDWQYFTNCYVTINLHNLTGMYNKISKVSDCWHLAFPDL